MKLKYCFGSSIVLMGLMASTTSAQEDTPVRKVMQKTRQMKRHLYDQGVPAGGATTRNANDDLAQIRAFQQGNFDFYKDYLKPLAAAADNDTIMTAFDHFKVLQASKAYMDYLNSGANDPELQLTAMRQGIIEVADMLAGVKDVMSDKDSLNSKVEEFVTYAQGDGDLSQVLKDLEAGDKNAMPKLQQAFANKFFGGLNLDAVNDVEMLGKARANLLGNEDIMRIIGKNNPDIVELLSSDDLAPGSKDIDVITASIEKLAARYTGGTVSSR